MFRSELPDQSTAPQVHVEWKPFQIDPGTALEGETFEAYCRRRWGGSGWTRHLRSEGAGDGAHFSNWKWWPNTLKAHQLVLFAEQRGVGSHETNAAIFKAMYEEGKNVALTDVLVQIGVDELNLPREELQQYLENDVGADEVRREIQSGRRRYRISGVPFFVIGGGTGGTPYGLSGAQSPRTLLDVLKELAE